MTANDAVLISLPYEKTTSMENIQLSKNLTVNYLTLIQPNPMKVRFHCTFFGEEYVADVSKRNVMKDWASVEVEGKSELFDSFTSRMEDEFWDEVKKIFNEFEAQQV